MGAHTFKMTKKGNVKEVDDKGSVLNRYVAVPYTSCRDCAFYKGQCMGVVCTSNRREDAGYDYREVHFVLKAKKNRGVLNEHP